MKENNSICSVGRSFPEGFIFESDLPYEEELTIRKVRETFSVMFHRYYVTDMKMA